MSSSTYHFKGKQASIVLSRALLFTYVSQWSLLVTDRDSVGALETTYD